MFFLMFREQWYYCNTCKYAFPISEIDAHKGHNYHPTTSIG